MTDYWHRFTYDTIFHLYNKSVSQRKLFFDGKDCRKFLNKFHKLFGPYIVLYAYCLIPNHFHLMFRIKERREFDEKIIKDEGTKASIRFLADLSDPNILLEDQMRRLFGGMAMYLNKRYKQTGPVFLERPKRVHVNSDERFYDLLCYIHHNPIHHFLAKNYSDWKFSSYSKYLSQEEWQGISEVLSALGNGTIENGRKEFILMHDLYKQNFDWNSYR